jgi:hypothetical protein
MSDTTPPTDSELMKLFSAAEEGTFISMMLYSANGGGHELVDLAISVGAFSGVLLFAETAGLETDVSNPDNPLSQALQRYARISALSKIKTQGEA